MQRVRRKGGEDNLLYIEGRDNDGRDPTYCQSGLYGASSHVCSCSSDWSRLPARHRNAHCGQPYRADFGADCWMLKMIRIRIGGSGWGCEYYLHEPLSEVDVGTRWSLARWTTSSLAELEDILLSEMTK